MAKRLFCSFVCGRKRFKPLGLAAAPLAEGRFVPPAFAVVRAFEARSALLLWLRLTVAGWELEDELESFLTGSGSLELVESELESGSGSDVGGVGFLDGVTAESLSKVVELPLSLDIGSEEALGIEAEADGVEELDSSELELDGIEELTTGLELDSVDMDEDAKLELELLGIAEVLVELVTLDDGVLDVSAELEEATVIGLSTCSTPTAAVPAAETVTGTGSVFFS